jgi:tRNA(adenine34) deaminase
MIWNELTHPWQCCLEEAWAAYCGGSAPIGAVITDADGQVISRSRSRLGVLAPEGSYLHNGNLTHAEVRALVALDYQRYDPPHSCILYTTTEPCPMCFGTFYMSGLRELRYAARDPYAGSVNLLGTTPYLQRKPIRIVGPERTDLEIVIMALNVEWRLHYRGEDWRLRYRGGARDDVVLATWAPVIPQAVHLGTALFESGDLRRMRERGISAAAACDQLAARIGDV